MRAIRDSESHSDSQDRPAVRRVPFRRFISPVVVGAALGVGYLLLTNFVPKLSANLGSVPENVGAHWSAPIWSAAEVISQNRGAALGAAALATSLAVLLTVVSRPTAVLVYVAGVGLCLLDIVMLLGALSYFYGQLLDNVL